MSLIKTFMDAFKKASASKEQGALEQVRNQAGLGVSADTDAFEPLPQPGGTPGGTANFIPNPQVPKDVEPIRRPPSQPKPPTDGDQGPIEGASRAPGAPGNEDPEGGDDTVLGLRRPPTGLKADELSVAPIDDGGEVARPRAPLEVKGENAGILEDPDAGGEVAAARGSLDAIDKGMKEAGEKADIAIAEDPDAGGEVLGRLRSPAGFRGEDVKLAEDPDAGGEVLSRLRPRPPVGQEIPAGPLEEQVTPIDDGGEVAGARRPPIGGYIGETEKNLDLSSSDPEEGGEIFKDAKFKTEPADLKFGEAKVEIPDDADAGDEVTNLQRQVIDNSAASQIPRSGAAAMTDDGPVPVPYPNAQEEGTLGAVDGEIMDKDHGFVSDLSERSKSAASIGSVSPEPPPNLQAEDRALADDLARKAGESQKDFPDIKLQDSPELDDDGLAGALARKAGEGQKDFFKVQMEDVLVTSARTEGEPSDSDELPDDETGPEASMRVGHGPKTIADLDSSLSSDEGDVPSDDDDPGSAGWSTIGKYKKKGFNRDEMDETLGDRESSADIDGESTTADHEGEVAFARRTEVKDAHDRFSDTKPDTPPRPPAQLLEDDDDFESSSLLDLKPASASREMLPGLAGELPDDADLELDLDDDLEDADESEL